MMIINICSLSCYELTLCSLSCCSSLVMSSCARWRLPDFVFNSAVLVSKSFLACFNSFSIFSFFLASRCASLLRTWMSSLSWSSKSKEKIKTTIKGQFHNISMHMLQLIFIFPLFQIHWHTLPSRAGWGGGGYLGISGWGCAAESLEPLTFTRASSAEFWYPILE